MKNIILSLAILSFSLASCELQPESSFYTSKVDIEVGEEIQFTNSSINAWRYEWDFGDGSRSTSENPVYSYRSTGAFQVSLAAISKKGNADYSYQIINVSYPTTLMVEVLEWEKHYPVPGASVILYPSLKDWDNETNPVIEGFTDIYGKVVFTGLEPKIYFLDIWEQNHNNFDLRDYDVSYIRTQQLTPKAVNTFVAYVDYVGGKGSAPVLRNRSLSSHSFERKPAESY